VPTPFSAAVVDDPAEARIVLHGDVTADADPALPDAYAAATANGATAVALDFADVGFMNSTGIALVVELLADAMRHDRQLSASGLSEHYREIFEITRLADHITVVDSPTDHSPATGGTP
jgi:anti-sigma B factor antagonist